MSAVLLENNDKNGAKQKRGKERLSKGHVDKVERGDDDEHSGRVMKRGQVLLSKFKVLRLLSQGGFGQVYIAQEEGTNKKVAVKAEPILTLTSLFVNERHVHETLACYPHQNFLQYYADGKTAHARFLVLQLCGLNLRDLKKSAKDQKFSIPCSLGLALQMVEALRHLHNIGFVHRDIKPANLCMGLTGTINEDTLYLLDFGLSKRHFNYEGYPVPPRPGTRGFRGTPRYASVNILQGKDIGRVDDLWSVFYILLEQIIGVLPWRMVLERDEVSKLKQDTDYAQLLRLCPHSFAALWHQLNVLVYESKPNYQQILDHVQNDISHILGLNKLIMDWKK